MLVSTPAYMLFLTEGEIQMMWFSTYFAHKGSIWQVFSKHVSTKHSCQIRIRYFIPIMYKDSLARE